MLRISKISNLIVICILGLIVSGQNITRVFEVEPGGRFDLDATFGAIRVGSGPADQVKVRVIFADTDFEEKYQVEFEQHHSLISVKSEYDDESIWFWQCRKKPRVKFEVTVPEEFNLILKTSGGSVSVSSLDGDVSCKTSGGSIQVDRIKGNVELRTSGGSISLESCHGNAIARTSGGSIYIGKVYGEVNAHTSGGGITVDEVMGPINADTSGGSIRVTITEQPEEDCRLKTSGGQINVTMSRHIAVSLDAKTSGGKVYSEFSFDSAAGRKGHHLSGDINGGGPELYLRTSGGNIKIRK